MGRIVVDTSVVVAAVRSRNGPANALMRLVATRKLVPLATPPLFLEYEGVLKRPEQQLAHRLDHSQIEDFLSQLAALIESVEIHFKWRPLLRDPADEMVLEAAINGHADAVVTYNIADFAPGDPWFKIPILKPQELLRKVNL